MNQLNIIVKDAIGFSSLSIGLMKNQLKHHRQWLSITGSTATGGSRDPQVVWVEQTKDGLTVQQQLRGRNVSVGRTTSCFSRGTTSLIDWCVLLSEGPEGFGPYPYRKSQNRKLLPCHPSNFKSLTNWRTEWMVNNKQNIRYTLPCHPRGSVPSSN